MARRSKAPPSDPFLVAELRQIEADHRAAGEADRAAFREAWAKKMAAAPPPKPIHVSKFISTRVN